MKSKKLQYLIYLIFLHCFCIGLTVSRFSFPEWGRWLVNTRFFHTPISAYLAIVIVLFPALAVTPYFFTHDFPNVSARRKLTLAGLIIGNAVLILAYTSLITKIMS